MSSGLGFRAGVMIGAAMLAMGSPPFSGVAGAEEADEISTEPMAVDGESVSAEEAEKRLQGELRRLRQKHHLPALWAGKFYADGRSIAAADGLRKWTHEAAVETSDVIHLGSCTKAMTAVLIAQLCTEGAISFETTLSEIFPQVEGLADSAWGEVAVEDLLRHRSGAPANASWWKLHNAHPDDVVAARRDMLRWLVEQERPQAPKYLYSNVGYALLGHIVETIEGEPWESAIRKRLFKPLGVETAGFGPVGVPESNAANESEAPQHPWGHEAQASLADAVSTLVGKAKTSNFKPLQIDNAPPLGPAGRVHMTLRDWAKFVLLFASDQGCGKVGVEPEVWSTLLQTSGEGDYAGGWTLLERDWAGGRTLFHNGSNTTWYCVAFVAPKKNFCLLAATNTYSKAAFQGCDAAVTTANTLGF